MVDSYLMCLGRGFLLERVFDAEMLGGVRERSGQSLDALLRQGIEWP